MLCLWQLIRNICCDIIKGACPLDPQHLSSQIVFISEIRYFKSWTEVIPALMDAAVLIQSHSVLLHWFKSLCVISLSAQWLSNWLYFLFFLTFYKTTEAWLVLLETFCYGERVKYRSYRNTAL